LKSALLDPDATTTEPGTVKAAWLLASATITPPEGAAPLSATVQPSVCVEITCDPAHVNAVTVGSSSTGGLAVTVTEADAELLLALPVTVTALSEETVPAVTLKLALLDPDATVTEAGTANAA
jgi:hypothetical protein